MQRLETEAKTIGKLFAVESQNLWPPVADSLVVDNGFEKALGAVLGDDLDAPLDDSAPMHWAGATVDPSDPQLPDGVTALAQYVKAPPQLARRLAQIGVVDRAAGAQLAALLKPGQRLVSREGDYWRWDGFAAAAHAPTGAARRLAERGRLQAIEGELEAARADVAAKRQTLELAEAAVTAAAAAEVQARMQWRDAQRLTDNAREEHTAAEREIARNAARISALKEARVRISAGCDEALAGQREATAALAALPVTADLEAKLAAVNDVIATDRGALAEVRVEAQAIMREAELASRRLQAITEERQAWNERKDNAETQIATIGQRVEEASGERAELTERAGKIRFPAPGADRRDRDRHRRAPRRRRPARRRRERSCRGRQGRARGA